MELPPELLQEIKVSNVIARPASPVSRLRNQRATEIPETDIRLGQHVFHKKFGEGIVINYEGQGKQARIQVNFKAEGDKWLVYQYARLQILD